jgi:endothelin-converting enzyme/putative endopeptidase
LSGCNASKQSGPVTEPALVSGIDKTAIDKNTRPQDDFFRYVNGTWLDETEIPASKSRYGVFNFLFDETQIQLQTIIQQASTNQTNPNQRKLGDFYQSYMDVEAANLKQLTLSCSD